jgi:hypothetical protein
MNYLDPGCRHKIESLSGVGVVACAACGTVGWWGADLPLDPVEGMTRLFGQFDLLGSLPSLRAPSSEVLVYRPPNWRHRSRLKAFPQGVWLEVNPDLWLTHDGEHLLLAPTDPLLSTNLQR